MISNVLSIPSECIWGQLLPELTLKRISQKNPALGILTFCGFFARQNPTRREEREMQGCASCTRFSPRIHEILHICAEILAHSRISFIQLYAVHIEQATPETQAIYLKTARMKIWWAAKPTTNE
jgi:hypothetical protein